MAPDELAAVADLLRTIAAALDVPQPARHTDDALYLAALVDRKTSVRVAAEHAADDPAEPTFARLADWLRKEVDAHPANYQPYQPPTG